MYKCTNRYCKERNINLEDGEADLRKGECKTCGNALSDEKGFGWAHNDALKEKPVKPDSLQAKAAAKAKAPVAAEKPVTSVPSPPIPVVPPKPVVATPAVPVTPAVVPQPVAKPKEA